MTAPPSAPPISRSWARPWTLVRSQHLWFLAVGAYNTAFGYAVFAGIHLAAPHLHYMLVLLVTLLRRLRCLFVGHAASHHFVVMGCVPGPN